MGVFHVFKIEQMVSNRAMHQTYATMLTVIMNDAYSCYIWQKIILKSQPKKH